MSDISKKEPNTEGNQALDYQNLSEEKVKLDTQSSPIESSDNLSTTFLENFEKTNEVQKDMNKEINNKGTDERESDEQQLDANETTEASKTKNHTKKRNNQEKHQSTEIQNNATVNKDVDSAVINENNLNAKTEKINEDKQSDTAQKVVTQSESSSIDNVVKKASIKSNKDSQSHTQSSIAPDNFSNNQHRADSTTMNKPSKTSIYISIISLLIAATSLGGSYLMLKNKADSTNTTLLNEIETREKSLKDQINHLKQQVSLQEETRQAELNQISLINTQMKQTLEQFSQEQQKAIRTFSLEQETSQSRFVNLEDKVNRLATQDNTNWLIAQADFYLKMAARRLWAEKDILTAMTLLKTADNSLAQMNDSSLVPIREAIATDIATLASIESPDVDGVISSLSGLTRSVDGLILKPEFRRPERISQTQSDVSDNLSDWRQNFMVNLQDFSRDFIQIRRVDSHGNTILSPEQAIYLKENIRARLFLATQAVSRQQESVYQETLDDIINNVNDFFDENSPLTVHFLEQLKALKKQPLSLTLPEKFVSSEPVARLVNERITNWIRPAANNTKQENTTETFLERNDVNSTNSTEGKVIIDKNSTSQKAVDGIQTPKQTSTQTSTNEL